MNDSQLPVISRASEWERRHDCNTDGPRVSMSSGLFENIPTHYRPIVNIITSETSEDEQARRTIPILSQAPGDHFPHTQGCYETSKYDVQL
jgi:hypothetical protein